MLYREDNSKHVYSIDKKGYCVCSYCDIWTDGINDSTII